MQIQENITGGILRIEFIIHKSIVKTEYILINDKGPEEIFEEKKEIVKRAAESISFALNGKEKEIIKAWGEVDSRFKELYKTLYPWGGWRKGGRPQGSKTNKTETFKKRITPDELEFLEKCLSEYRAKKKK